MKKLFKIEIEGNLENDFIHVNVIDNLYEGEKGDGLRFMLAYKELANYIHMYMPNMSKETMISVIEEIYSDE